MPDSVEDYRGYSVDLRQDESPEDPHHWDNLGQMVCFHRRYSLPNEAGLDSHDFDSWNTVEQHLKEELHAVVVLPLFLYDHSGLRIKVSSFAGWLPQGHAEWDSGQIGFIFVTHEVVQREYGDVSPASIQKAEDVLRGEVETYDQYLSGDVWGYVVRRDGNILDSVWGYYGSDGADEAIQNARASINNLAERLVQSYAS